MKLSYSVKFFKTFTYVILFYSTFFLFFSFFASFLALELSLYTWPHSQVAPFPPFQVSATCPSQPVSFLCYSVQFFLWNILLLTLLHYVALRKLPFSSHVFSFLLLCYQSLLESWRALCMSFTYKSCCVLCSTWMYPIVSLRAFGKKSCFVFSSPNLSCPFSSLHFESLFSASCACLLFLQLLHHLFWWFDGNDLWVQYQVCVLHQFCLLYFWACHCYSAHWSSSQDSDNFSFTIFCLFSSSLNCPCAFRFSPHAFRWIQSKQLSIDPHSTPSGLLWWFRWQRVHLQCRRPRVHLWAGKIPWRRAWQPTPVFLPGESPWTEESGWLQSMVLQSVIHTFRWIQSNLAWAYWQLSHKTLSVFLFQ